MRLHLRFLFAAAFVAVGATALPADTAALHHRIRDLDGAFHEWLDAEESEQALGILAEMKAIDPRHPLIGALASYMYRDRAPLDEAEALVRAVGPAEPGLTAGLARLHVYNKQYAEAELLAREALEHYRDLGHRPGQAYCHALLGRTLRARKRLDEARAEYDAARTFYGQLDDPAAEARAMRGLSKVERLTGNFEAALALDRDVLAIWREIGDEEPQIDAWYGMALTLLAADRPAEAIDPLNRTLELEGKLGKLEGSYTTLEKLARVHQGLFQDREVRRCWTEAASVAEELGDQRKLALAHRELGAFLFRRGDPDAAVPWLRLAVEADHAMRRADAVYARRVLGQSLARAGNLSEAASALQSSLDLASQMEDSGAQRVQIAKTLAALASYSLSAGEPTQALGYLERALELWRREPPVKTEEAETLNDLAMTHFRLGRVDTAGRLLDEALRIAEEVGYWREMARVHNSLSVLCTDDGRTDEALSHLETSIRIRQEHEDWRGVALARDNLARTLWRLGRREEATRTLELALEGFRDVGDRENELSALNRSAEYLLARGEQDAAVAVYSRSIRQAREHGFQMPLYHGLAGRAGAYEKTGALAAAARDLEQALDVIESLRRRVETSELKMRFFAGKMDLYEHAVDIDLRLDETSAAGAFRLAERSRARSLLDSLTEARVTERAGLRGDLAQREKRLIGELSAAAVELTASRSDEQRIRARVRLDSAEDRLRSLEVEIRRQAPRYSDIVYTQPIALRETQEEVLQTDETLLRYFIGEDRAMLWIVSRDEVRFLTLPHPDEIGELVAEYREQAGRATVRLGGDAAGAAQAERLAAALGVANLPEDHRILVVPDGPIHHLPFDALRIDGRYLIEDHEIVVVPSATTLKVMRDEPSSVAAGGFLGVGDPLSENDDPRFPPLPQTGKALDRIALLFPEDRRVVLKGEQATKETLQAQSLDRFRYLHFATHGWLDAERPRYFGLQLSDDFLYLDEVFSMRLGAELVVLAACSSGLGEMLAGEGIVGMTRGFLYAGARSLLVSLWDVDDRASAEFMEAFYKELIEGSSIPEALRTVKLSFIRSKRPAQRQPHQWAPFVLVGDAAQGSTTSKDSVSSGSSAPGP